MALHALRKWHDTNVAGEQTAWRSRHFRHRGRTRREPLVHGDRREQGGQSDHLRRLHRILCSTANSYPYGIAAGRTETSGSRSSTGTRWQRSSRASLPGQRCRRCHITARDLVTCCRRLRCRRVRQVHGRGLSRIRCSGVSPRHPIRLPWSRPI